MTSFLMKIIFFINGFTQYGYGIQLTTLFITGLLGKTRFISNENLTSSKKTTLFLTKKYHHRNLNRMQLQENRYILNENKLLTSMNPSFIVLFMASYSN